MSFDTSALTMPPSIPDAAAAAPPPGAAAGADRPRLAIVCRACGVPGSVAGVAVRQSRELAATFRVALVSDSFPSDVGGARAVGIHPWRLGALRRFAHVPAELAFCLAATAALRSLAARGELDLVLFHSHAAAAVAIPRLRRHRHLRFAMLTHGDIFERPAGTYDPRLTAFYRAVTPRAYRACDLVVALSPDMREWALRGGASADRVLVLPNGVDTSDLGMPPEALSEPMEPDSPAPLRVLYVGRLAAEKGVGVLLEALARLHEGGVPFRASIVGAGPDSASHATFVARHGLGGVVEMKGAVPRAQLATHYRGAHVVCVPSLSDPLPTVVLEALALGRPVLGTAVGGIPFLVEDGVNGLLVPPGDAAALAAGLDRLARDPALCASLAGRARESVYPRYSWEGVAAQLGGALLRLRAGSVAEAGPVRVSP